MKKCKTYLIKLICTYKQILGITYMKIFDLYEDEKFEHYVLVDWKVSNYFWKIVKLLISYMFNIISAV